MSKFDDCMASYTKQLEGAGVKVDTKLLTKVAKGLGPSIYKKDASTVAGSDPKELGRVRKNFLVKKLGCKDTDKLDDHIKDCINTIGKSKRNKYRAVLYYLLVKKLKKSKVYA